jgi:hypothetical protein
MSLFSRLRGGPRLAVRTEAEARAVLGLPIAALGWSAPLDPARQATVVGLCAWGPVFRDVPRLRLAQLADAVAADLALAPDPAGTRAACAAARARLSTPQREIALGYAVRALVAEGPPDDVARMRLREMAEAAGLDPARFGRMFEVLCRMCPPPRAA